LILKALYIRASKPMINKIKKSTIKRKPFEGLSSLYKRLKDQGIKET
jgi:phosphatidate phosphatase APP1